MVLLNNFMFLSCSIQENPVSELTEHKKGICALHSEETPGMVTVPRKQRYKNGVSCKRGVCFRE